MDICIYNKAKHMFHIMKANSNGNDNSTSLAGGTWDVR